MLVATSRGLLRVDGQGRMEAGCGALQPSSLPGTPALALTPACSCSCSATGVPPEVALDLRVRAGGWISWGSSVAACECRLHRGDVAHLGVVPADCIGSGYRTGLAFDPALPGAGRAFFYFVSGATTSGEGTLGFDSLGVERRRGAPCP